MLELARQFSPVWTPIGRSHDERMPAAVMHEGSFRATATRGVWSGDRRVPVFHRLLLSILLGGVSGGVTLQKALRIPYSCDFGPVWFAARAILRGADPYALIGAGRAYEWPWPFLFPLPAAIVAIPVAPLSRVLATVLFSFLAGAAFAWALMEHGYGPLFGFFGGALHYAAETAQWSPLLAAAVVVPPLSFLLIAKPNIGAAIFVA